MCIGGDGFISVADDIEKKTLPIRVGSMYYLRAGAKFVLNSSGSVIGKSAADLIAVRVGINESVAPEGSCVLS